jgi:cyclic-di-GMP phosphodiesterase TipF (flagellum assembly factor)
MKRRPGLPRQRAETRRRKGGGAVDLFVVLAMGVVVFALSTALNLQFGVDINVAMAAGTVLYAALLGLHALRRRRQPGQTARRAAASPDFESFSDVHDRLAVHVPPPVPLDRALSQLEVPSSMRPRAKVAQVSLPPLGEHTAQKPSGGPGGAPRQNTGPVTAPGQLGGGHPSAFGHPGAPSARSGPPALPESALHAQPGGGNSLESDVERIQALVKKLANEINAADEAAEDVSRPPRLPMSDAAANASVGALRQAAEGMKSAAAPPPLGAMRPGAGPQQPFPASQRPAPPPLSPAQAHIAAVADSLVAGRVEVELEPVLSLVDQQTTHYEVSVNVHGANGERLVENDGPAGLQGTGLLPLFDSARLSRSVSIAQRLQERGKKGRILSTYCSESLTNPSFLADVRSALHERAGIGAQLVIGFSQSELHGFSSSEWSAIAELRQMHVVFSLDRLTHLDLDLKHLVTLGFAFARVEGNLFLSGLRFGGRPVTGNELARYITGSGMTLVVTQIDNELQLQRLGQVGVQLGQGRVFGGRRTVKLSATKSSTAAA